MEDNNILKSGTSNDQDVLLVRPFENPPFQNPEFLNHTHNGIDSPLIFANNLLKLSGAGQAATFVIGPATNSDSSTYDYVTDGTDDNVEIQAAIDALPTNGGMIVFREGTYTLGSATVNVNKTGVTLMGMGGGSIITCKNSFNKIFFQLGSNSTQYYNFLLTNFYINGNKDNVTMSDKPLIDNRNITYPIINAQYKNCYWINIASSILYANNNSVDRFEDNYVTTWDNQGSSSKKGYPIAYGCYVINNTFVVSNTATGVMNGASPSDGVFINNKIALPDTYNFAILNNLYKAQDNIIYMTTGNAGASAIGIQSTSYALNNVIDFGSSANIASIGIEAYEWVSNNIIAFAGKGVTFITGASSIVQSNQITSRANGIDATSASSSSPSSITDNKITSSLATDNTYDGITLGNGVFAIIKGNYIYSNNLSFRIRYGIRESNSATRSIVDGNWVIGAQTEAISIQNPLSDVGHNIIT